MHPKTIWSLNGGRFLGKTPEEEGSTLTWLKGLSEPGTVVPDVLCLQDFRVSLLQYLRPLPHFHFAPMTSHKIFGKRELTGIAIASRYPLNDIRVHYTYGGGTIKDLDGVGNDNHRWSGDRAEEADRRVLETEWRVAVAVSVCGPDGRYRIATHHGFWVRGGVPTAEQLQSTKSLCAFLLKDSDDFGGLVYIADCNLDKEGEVLRRYVASGARDCLPPEVKTTVVAHHPAAKFGAKPDRVMVFPSGGNYRYDVFNVYMDPSPGSDHDMLCATVHRI
ncbi:hypothetical protein HY412_01525 [Candidatus Kaiserbacteria bacterium]|nr:hypothetical protein [Candidatus Kaiserbacteria bacterium]